MKANNLTRWDAIYDVVVLGFGGAGATAARFAADAGSKVLLVDAAPEGHEGGNTRYAEQVIASGDDVEGLKTYHRAMAAPLAIDEDQLDTFVEGLVNMGDYIKDAFGTEPYRFKKDPNADPLVKQFTEEFPELPGAGAYDLTTVHKGFGDSGLWKALRKAVMDRQDRIDVWYSSPARHLLQAADGTVLGAQIERGHVLRNIRARNGVIMTTGGFENNQRMIQEYLGADYLAPIGTLYNHGIGITMAQEVGADLAHMQSYESLGLLHGLSIRTTKGKRGKGNMAVVCPPITQGSVFAIGTDGTRYFKEDEVNRHGKINDHGTAWRAPAAQSNPFLIFDQTKFDELQNVDLSNYPLSLRGILTPDLFKTMTEQAVKADSVAELAHQIGVSADKLTETVSDFNFFATHGKDYAFHRDPKSLRALDDGPYYALALRQNMLNTQGGARRNSRTEVLDTTGTPIPHLYEAGELGALFVNQYAGGGNLAELLIFGKIAGENAAVPKATTVPLAENAAQAVEAETTPSSTDTLGTDATAHEDYPCAPNQAIGRSDAGMGGEVVVRVTVDDDHKLENVEVLEESESDDVASAALQTLPQEMVAKNTYEVDAATGASRSSRALKEAVQRALVKLS
ncbi:FAD-binding protein [Lactiplantibacillus garii]|uniref:Urocanate reductase n=1 Tax=Lactiplantibacillus garii TaxID=2306423 RepID=A0A3R8J6P9_9LACO|nr:FAD-binding protein [Lactiplantibacillus garii]RRK10232.1 FAD-binding protein [Lactiplantibacillus garii]